MSISTNIVIIAGRLTRDVDMRRTPSGVSVASFGLAVDDSYTKDGTRTERTVFVDVDAWSKLADLMAQYTKKGSPVLVEGKLQMDEWEDKTGARRTRLKVRAERVQFLESRKDANRGEPVAATERVETPPRAERPEPSADKDDDLPF